MKYAITMPETEIGKEIILKMLTLVPFSEIVLLTEKDENEIRKFYPNVLEIRQIDFDNLQNIQKALKDIDRLMLIPENNKILIKEKQLKQEKNIIDGAALSSVDYIALISFYNAEKNNSTEAKLYYEIEESIKNKNIKHSFLRNNLYLQDIYEIIKKSDKTNKFLYKNGSQKAGWALIKYYAEAAANILTNIDDSSNENNKEIYEFYGKEITLESLSKAIKNNVNRSSYKIESYTDIGVYNSWLQDIGLNKEEIDYQDKLNGMISNGDFSNQPYQGKDIKFGMTHDEILNNNINNESDLEHILGYPLPSIQKQIQELITNIPLYKKGVYTII